MKRIALLTIVVCLGLSTPAANLDAATNATLTTLFVFRGTNGDAPVAELALGTNGNLYGTTAYGGTGTNCIGGCGTVFEITPSGAFTLLHSFTDSGDDGYALRAGLLQASDGNLYGVTTYGGSFAGQGTVFRITPTGVFTNLHTFRNTEGLGPEGTLIEGADGILYGTTSEGGTFGSGTAFQITTNGVFAHLNANPSPGLDQPTAGLVLASDGNLYGTSEFGGSSANCIGGCGAIYRITTDGFVTNLHSFTKTDGSAPVAELIQGIDGNLYGTTSGGHTGLSSCTNGCGTVFMITTNGDFQTLHSFGGSDGREPRGPLVQGIDGNLYGTASAGGGLFAGTIFQITTNGDFTKLFSFANTNGAAPLAGLVQDANGVFYGTTEVGGGTNGAGLGTVFKLTLSASTNENSGADLAVSKSATSGPITLGSNITYTVTVTNKGPLAATGVELTDTLPSSVTFVSADDGCTNIGGVVTCDLANLGNAAGVSFQIVVTTTEAGSITNTVVVAAEEADPVATNNTAKAVTTVTGPSCADLTGAFVSVVPKCKVKGTNTTCQIKGSMSIQNIGTVDSTPCILRYYLSDDDVLDIPGDMALPDVALKAVKTAKPGKGKLSAKLAPNVLTSGRFVIAVIDADHTGAECNTNNNVVVFGPLP